MSLKTSPIARAYDGSNVTYRLLRTFGWGPLLNLGYYPFPRPLTVLNFILTPALFLPQFRLPVAQTRLVEKALQILQLGSARHILDVGCGRGAGTFMIAGRCPDAQVTGVDILASNAQAASILYARKSNLSYLQADAMALPFADGRFDRLLCLEAAFHFPDRGRFLQEAARLLTRGGRLVLVDFVWRTHASRAQLSPELADLVRNTWQWDNFAAIDEYQSLAQRCGLKLVVRDDWSGHVTDPLQTVFKIVAALGRREWGRRLAAWYNPLLRSMSHADWDELEQSAVAHTEVRRHSRYVAFAFEPRG